ncbi:MAG TPA: acyl carrier protein [Caulobacteraceae bacterium]
MADASAPAPAGREEISRQVRETIAGFFQVPAERVNDGTVVDDIQGWDSTRHVGLILELEDQLGIMFDVERISAFENVGELIDECVRMVSAERT